MNNIKKLAAHPLVSGSSIVLVGSLAANFAHYLFNLIMGRLLTPSEYGLVASLVSITVLFAIFQSTLTSVFAKFAASFFAKKDFLSLSDLIKKGFLITLGTSAIIFVLLILLSNILSNFLHVTSSLILMLTFIYIFTSILSSLPIGILQGEMKSVLYSFLSIIMAILKIGFGVALVYLGFSAVGAMGGITISAFITLLIGIFFIRKDVRSKEGRDVKEEELLVREIKNYSIKFFLASLGIASFASMDIILARHFFPPQIAGQYAALAVMGKAIFYVTFPINFVFFPLIAQKKERNENVFEVLVLAAVITLLVSLLGSFVYFLFPNLVLAIFFPAPVFSTLAPYLGPYSLYIIIFALVSLLNSYLLSVGKTGIYKINLACGALLIFGIILFHESLFQMIGILFATSLFLLVLLLVYYAKYGRS